MCPGSDITFPTVYSIVSNQNRSSCWLCKERENGELIGEQGQRWPKSNYMTRCKISSWKRSHRPFGTTYRKELSLGIYVKVFEFQLTCTAMFWFPGLALRLLLNLSPNLPKNQWSEMEPWKNPSIGLNYCRVYINAIKFARNIWKSCATKLI